MSRFLQILLGLIGIGVIGGGIIAFVIVRGQSSSESTSSNSSSSENVQTSDSSKNTSAQKNTSSTKNSSASKNTNTTSSGNSSCDNFSIEGKWSLTADVQGATFTPPYANEAAFFEFGANGKVNFVEEYHDDGIDASAKHVGTWTKDGCGFVYSGVADGSGTSTDFGNFTLHFAITAPGTLNVSMGTLSGNWTSKETYESSSGITNQVVTGIWTAKKIEQ